MDFRQFFLSGLHSFIRAFRRVGLFRASPLIALNRVRIFQAMNTLAHEELAITRGYPPVTYASRKNNPILRLHQH